VPVPASHRTNSLFNVQKKTLFFFKEIKTMVGETYVAWLKWTIFSLQHRCILLPLNLNGLFQGDGLYSVKRSDDSERWRRPYSTRPTLKMYTNILWTNWENLGQNLFEATDYRYEKQTYNSKVLVLNTANDITVRSWRVKFSTNKFHIPCIN